MGKHGEKELQREKAEQSHGDCWGLLGEALFHPPRFVTPPHYTSSDGVYGGGVSSSVFLFLGTMTLLAGGGFGMGVVRARQTEQNISTCLLGISLQRHREPLRLWQDLDAESIGTHVPRRAR